MLRRSGAGPRGSALAARPLFPRARLARPPARARCPARRHDAGTYRHRGAQRDAGDGRARTQNPAGHHQRLRHHAAGQLGALDPAVQHEMLQMIDTHTDRLYDILNTLLDVWRLDAGTQRLRLAEVQFPALLKQLVERWRKHAPLYTFQLVLPAAMPPLACDAVRIEQAINHLLNNAVKYSPPGESITLQLDVNEVERCLSVSDHGAGIAPEHLDRIFDRFYRVPLDESENGPGGSGLGLAVARATIEAHGGRIWADSPGVGQGATFYCTLPLQPRLPSIASVALSSAAT